MMNLGNLMSNPLQKFHFFSAAFACYFSGKNFPFRRRIIPTSRMPQHFLQSHKKENFYWSWHYHHQLKLLLFICFCPNIHIWLWLISNGIYNKGDVRKCHIATLDPQNNCGGTISVRDVTLRRTPCKILWSFQKFPVMKS